MQLASGYPYTVKGPVAGYLGATADCVSVNSANIASSSSKESGLGFSAQYQGTIAVAQYDVSIRPTPAPTPTGSGSPPPPTTYGRYRVVKYFANTVGAEAPPEKGSKLWVEAGAYSKSVNTTTGATQNVSIPTTLNGGQIVPSHNTSSSESHCASGFSGDTTITWPVQDTTTVQLDVYYWKNTPPDGSTVTKKEKKITYKWDDTDGKGEGSSFNSTTPIDPDGIPIMQGKVEGDSVQEIYQIVTDPSMGSEGEILLPNGTNSGGNYVANTLKNVASCTSYLSRGEVTKHIVTYTIPATFHKVYGLSGSSTFTSNYKDNIVVSVIYFSLDKLEILQPDGAWIFNYAYNEIDEGGTVASDKRTPDDRFHTKLDFNGGTWEWGEAKNKKAKCEDSGLENLVFDLGSEALGSKPDETKIKDDCSDYLQDIMQDFLEEHFEVSSDTLIFKQPNWCSTEQNALEFGSADEKLHDYEEGLTEDEDGQDVGGASSDNYDDADAKMAASTNTVFDTDLYAFNVSCAVFSNQDDTDADVDLTDEEEVTEDEYEAKKNYTTLLDFGLEDLRVLALGYSNREDLFSNSGIKIPKEKLNTASGTEELPKPDSNLVVKYKPICNVNLNGGDRYFRSEDVNKVTLHTPIAMHVEVKEAADDMIQNTTVHEGSGRVVPLGTPFTLSLDYVGDFIGIYGTVDTEKYTLEDRAAWMQFEYESWVKHPDGSIDYHPENERYKLYDVDKCTFYAAYWAQEGNLGVHVTVEALNTYSSGNSGGVLPKGDCVEDFLNLDRDNYCAESVVMTDVCGRLFGLRQYDVADYPALQSVFRKGDSYTKTNNVITSGSKNFLGTAVSAPTDFTKGVAIFPIVDNDRIDGISYDAYKTGYVVRYNVTTIASLTNQSDNLLIEPTFYWVKKGVGEQQKKKVKLYYNENVNGTNSKLIEVGSKEDQENWHQICIGDSVNDVDVACLVDTSRAQGYSEPKDLIQQVANTWTYSGIRMPGSTAVCEGALYEKNSAGGPGILHYASDGTKLGIPDNLDWTMLNRCLQTWYGEYYLPNDLHVRLDNSKSNSAFERDSKSGVDFTEDYWCNDGYLVVNFNIRTLKAGEEHLSYNGKVLDPTHMDMWQQEDYCREKSGDWLQKFTFNEGDFIVYDLSTSMSEDYRSGGTH